MHASKHTIHLSLWPQRGRPACGPSGRSGLFLDKVTRWYSTAHIFHSALSLGRPPDRTRSIQNERPSTQQSCPASMAAVAAPSSLQATAAARSSAVPPGMRRAPLTSPHARGLRLCEATDGPGDELTARSGEEVRLCTAGGAGWAGGGPCCRCQG